MQATKRLKRNRRQDNRIYRFFKKEGMSYYGICNYIVSVKSFYTINHMTLNVKKLCKFMPEYKRVRKDKSYTLEEISRLLEIASDPNFNYCADRKSVV